MPGQMKNNITSRVEFNSEVFEARGGAVYCNCELSQALRMEKSSREIQLKIG